MQNLYASLILMNAKVKTNTNENGNVIDVCVCKATIDLCT